MGEGFFDTARLHVGESQMPVGGCPVGTSLKWSSHWSCATGHLDPVLFLLLRFWPSSAACFYVSDAAASTLARGAGWAWLWLVSTEREP